MIEINEGDLKIRGSRTDIISEFSTILFALYRDDDFKELIFLLCEVILSLKDVSKEEEENEFKRLLAEKVDKLIEKKENKNA